jgi:D-glycero-alpha-D-manno-heptose-7-phosphate kinase
MNMSVTNEFIDEYYEDAMKAGAIGGKLLGAGGGGFLLFYVKPENQQRVRDALSDLKEFDFNFEFEGSKVVYNQ